jgi:hypothetical protein
VLVTEAGHRLTTDALPKSADDVERAIGREETPAVGAVYGTPTPTARSVREPAGVLLGLG